MDFTTLARIEREIANRNLVLYREFYSRRCGEMSKKDIAVAGLGHYFIANGVNRWEDQIFGRARLEESDLESWRQFILMNYQGAKAFGIQFRYLVVPEKQIVLPQFRWIDSGESGEHALDNRPINHIKALFPGGDEFPLVYPVETFKAHQGECELYFRGNSHWCYTGCWLAGLDMVRSFFPDPSFQEKLASIDIKTERHVMQHDLLLHYSDNVPFEEYISIETPGTTAERHYTIKETGHHTGSSVRLINEHAPIQEKLAIIGDSYSLWVIGVFSHFFREVHFMWTKQINWQRMSDMQFKYVVWQSAERFLIVPPLSRILEVL
jgi:hypothetical protein